MTLVLCFCASAAVCPKYSPLTFPKTHSTVTATIRQNISIWNPWLNSPWNTRWTIQNSIREKMAIIPSELSDHRSNFRCKYSIRKVCCTWKSWTSVSLGSWTQIDHSWWICQSRGRAADRESDYRRLGGKERERERGCAQMCAMENIQQGLCESNYTRELQRHWTNISLKSNIQTLVTPKKKYFVSVLGCCCHGWRLTSLERLMVKIAQHILAIYFCRKMFASTLLRWLVRGCLLTISQVSL